MHFGIKSLLAAAVLGLTGLGAPAGAQDVKQVSYEELLDRVARLEQEVAEAPSVPMAPPAAADTSTDDGGFYAQYDNVIVTPYFSQNTSQVLNGPGANTVQPREFNWDLEYSPRFEVGNVDACSGTGWRARYWHFEHSETDRFTTAAGGPQAWISPDVSTGIGIFAQNGSTAQAQHSLRMSVADLEMLKRDISAEGGFTASVGLRYARIDQWNRGRVNAPGGALLANNSLHHDFEGIGPTIFAEYLKRFDCSYWGAFINARGALLYGESNYRYDARNAAGAIAARSRNINDQDLMSVVEMQIGADYRRPTASCHEIFLRVALEAQYWANAGSASIDMIGNGGASGNAQDADLGFLGVTVSTGLDW